MLIVLEGPDGCGKTTQAKQLSNATGYQVRSFPDRTTDVGGLINRYLKRELKTTGSLADDALIFQALQVVNRMEHFGELITAAGSPTHHLILDRYTPSGFVYGQLDGLGLPYLKTLHQGLPVGDVNILLMASPEARQGRLRARQNLTHETPDRYELPERLSYQSKVAELYEALWDDASEQGDQSYIIIEGDGTMMNVHRTICECIELAKEAIL